MIKTKSTSLTLAIVVLALVLCQSCNPYTEKRVPLGNSPYMSCKNCKTKVNAGNQAEDRYDFVSDEDQKTIQPLPIEAPASNKPSKPVQRKPGVVYHKKHSVRRATTKKNSNPSASSDNYVKLSETPAKQYQADQQQAMAADKKASMQNLLDKSAKITAPTPSSTTLPTEQAPAAPNPAEAAKLNDKLQELQKMSKDNAPAPTSTSGNMNPQEMVLQQPEMAQPQPVIEAQPEQPIQPIQPVQPAQQMNPIEPIQQLPVQPAPIEPVPALPEVVQPAQPAPPVQPAQPMDQANMQDMPSSAYDLTNKPIPLPH